MIGFDWKGEETKSEMSEECPGEDGARKAMRELLVGKGLEKVRTDDTQVLARRSRHHQNLHHSLLASLPPCLTPTMP